MEKIIEPVSVELLKAELNENTLLCRTHKGGNLIYVTDAHESPNVMRELGRLREEAFRRAGGSSGHSMDIDEFDTMAVPYRQIIVWDPDAEAIMGGYRYILGPDVSFDGNGQPLLSTSHMFHFSERFLKDYLPHTIELGRSFVTPEYQSSRMGAKSLFALDNLWDGISMIVMRNPRIHYIFGKFTMYPDFNAAAKDLILHFYWKHFGDKEGLVTPHNPVMPVSRPELMDLILSSDDFKTDYKLLKEAVRKLGTNIPPLVNSYMSVSPTLRMFGTAINDELSNVDDTAILVTFEEMYEEKVKRHLNSLINLQMERAKKRYPGVDHHFGERLMERLMSRRLKLYNRFKKNE